MVVYSRFSQFLCDVAIECKSHGKEPVLKNTLVCEIRWFFGMGMDYRGEAEALLGMDEKLDRICGSS